MHKLMVILAAGFALAVLIAAPALAQTAPGPTDPSVPDQPDTIEPRTGAPLPPQAPEDPASSDDVYVPAQGEVTTLSHTSTLRSCGVGFTITHDESQLMQLVNNKRAELGNERMCVDRRLMRSSQDWANYMANNHVFYHSGVSNLICGRHGYCGYDKAYENIGYRGDRTPAVVSMFNGYLNSQEGHRGAMLGLERDRMGTAWRGNDRGPNGYAFNAMHMTNHPGE